MRKMYIEKRELKGEYAYLTYSDNDVVKVSKEDFNRAFATIVNASKDAVIRDFAVKD